MRPIPILVERNDQSSKTCTLEISDSRSKVILRKGMCVCPTADPRGEAQCWQVWLSNHKKQTNKQIHSLFVLFTMEFLIISDIPINKIIKIQIFRTISKTIWLSSEAERLLFYRKRKHIIVPVRRTLDFCLLFILPYFILDYNLFFSLFPSFPLLLPSLSFFFCLFNIYTFHFFFFFFFYLRHAIYF